MTHDEIVTRLKLVVEALHQYQDYKSSLYLIRWDVEDLIDEIVSDDKWNPDGSEKTQEIDNAK